MRRRSGFLAVLAICVVAAIGPRFAAAEDAVSQKKDLQAVKKFLAASYPDKQWQQGPSRMQNAAIDNAYPNSRFYYVFSSQYPVARVEFVSALLRLDRAGNIVEFSGPRSFNQGLMKVADSDDAKTAAAAIMSLTFGPFGPKSVAASEVRVAREGRGWLCLATLGPTDGSGRRAPNVFEVRFDADGNCTAASHRYTGPLPICLGGLFQPIAMPREIPGLGHPLGGALEVTAIEPDSIADRAGLKPGDALVSFDGRPLPAQDTIQQMRQIVYPLKQQGQVERPIMVLRKGCLVRLALCW